MNNWWNYLEHSKGPWKNHKYAKVIDGVYYYPEDYLDGKYSAPDSESEKQNESRKHVSTEKKKKKTSGDGRKISEEELNQLALETIRGNYGNGQERKDKLGDKYADVQKRVNEIMKTGHFPSGRSGSSKMSSKSEEHKKRDYRYKTTVTTKTIGGKKRKVIKRERESIKHSFNDDSIQCNIGSYMSNNEFLMHYGMPRRSGRYPWGSGNDPFQGIKRKYENYKVRQSEKAALRKADRDERAQRLKDVKFRRTLSDKELNAKLDRLKREREYKQISSQEITPGKNFVSEVSSGAVKRVAATVLAGAMLYGIKAFVTKQGNLYEFGEAMYYGGPKRKK